MQQPEFTQSKSQASSPERKAVSSVETATRSLSAHTIVAEKEKPVAPIDKKMTSQLQKSTNMYSQVLFLFIFLKKTL